SVRVARGRCAGSTASGAVGASALDVLRGDEDRHRDEEHEHDSHRKAETREQQAAPEPREDRDLPELQRHATRFGSGRAGLEAYATFSETLKVTSSWSDGFGSASKTFEQGANGTVPVAVPFR